MHHQRKKIALIGGGQIGQNLAMLAAMKELGADADTAKLIRRGLKELAR